MSSALKQAPQESDYDFATRRLRTVATWSVVAAIARLLWWPAFPAIDRYGSLVLLLTGIITGLLVFSAIGLGLALVAALAMLAWCWVERAFPMMRTVRIRASAVGVRGLPILMVIGSGYVLIQSGLAGEIPTLRYVHRIVPMSSEPTYFAALWFMWLIVFFVGFIWALAQYARSRERRDD